MKICSENGEGIIVSFFGLEDFSWTWDSFCCLDWNYFIFKRIFL